MKGRVGDMMLHDHMVGNSAIVSLNSKLEVSRFSVSARTM